MISQSNELFIIKNTGVIKSVSIIFYSESDGFLLCDEMRKTHYSSNKKELKTHLIGGKVDVGDESPIYTGFREFCEETGYRIKDYSIKDSIHFLINELVFCKKIRINFCVNDYKKFYHVFYVINIDTIPDVNVKDNIFTFIKNWKKNNSAVIEKLFFYKKESNYLKLRNSTDLLRSFFTEISKFQL